MNAMTPSLTSLIGSRICHDLISPIGAISNGLELLSLTGATSGPEMSLIGDSVDNVNARIRFFRIAYGVAGDERLARSEICQLLQDLEKGSRARIVWDVEEDPPRAEVRLAFLALQCLETAMAYGGVAVVHRDAGGWTARAQAERMQIVPEIWDRFGTQDLDVPMTPALVQFALLPVVAQELGRSVVVDADEGALTIRF